MSADPWSPAQYEKFERERSQPFFDLVEMIGETGGRTLDLGCGTGALTAHLHKRVNAISTLGIDRSEAMLARVPQVDGLTFRQEGIEDFEPDDSFDLVFSNAALQWLPDHDALVPRIAAWVRTGGRLAFQVPANQQHPSHRIAREIAEREFGIEKRTTSVLQPERYAEILFGLGFRDLDVRLQVYVHALPGPESVVEWAKGTLLLAYRTQLSDSDFERFEARFREAVLDALPDARPYGYTFPRILVVGRRS